MTFFIRIIELVTERFLRPWLHCDFIYFKTNWGKLFSKSVEIFNDFSDKVRYFLSLQLKQKMQTSVAFMKNVFEIFFKQ